jgi:hypothetical protein
MAAAAAMRKNFYLGKKSEYRQNYLPFDYYDFWVTAKENENLRCRNKLRDYLHTPFDWDEDQDFYLETQTNHPVESSNHATQTSDRPNRRDHLKKVHKDFERHAQQQNQANAVKDQPRQAQSQKQPQAQQAKQRPQGVAGVRIEEPVRRPQTANAETATAVHHQNQPSRPTTSNVSRRPRRKNKRAVRMATRATPNTNHGIEVQGVYANLNDGRGVVSRPRRARSSSAKEYSYTPVNVDQQQHQRYEERPVVPKSQTSMAIQTPLGWNLRDFNSNSRPSSSRSKLLLLIKTCESFNNSLMFKNKKRKSIDTVNP